MRVVVTGADGFVGRHLCRHLSECGDSVVPLAGGAHSTGHDLAAASIDVRDGPALTALFSRVRPDALIHLAAVSSVADSHRDPVGTFEVNTIGTLNICQAAKELGPGVRVLLVSSGEVYGAIPPGTPAREDAPLAPTSPYGASKVAAEAVGIQFARSYGLRIVVARPFSHLGAGQAARFAIPSFAAQLAAARKNPMRKKLQVGNLEAVRDFSDVRDVVNAYRLLLGLGGPGEIYNVCSGHGRSLRSLLDELVELSGVDVDIEVDRARFRPADIPHLVGDATKLRGLGWRPSHTVRDALIEVLNETAHHGVADGPSAARL